VFIENFNIYICKKQINMYIIESIHPHGLGQAEIISGSRQIATNGNVYRYRPITATVVDLKFGGAMSGSFGLNTLAAGVDVYGTVTQITQSSGVAMIYYGLPDM
jgi:hypothetical protein